MIFCDKNVGMIGLQFRPAEVKDSDRVSELVNSVYRGDSAKEKSWTTEAGILAGQRCDPQMVSEIIEAEKHVVVIAEIINQIVGCVHLENKPGKKCYLGMLSVSLEHQNLGVAKKLLEYSEQFAKEKWGSGVVEIDVIALRKELIEYYFRKGFTLTGEKRPFPYGNERYGIPLREDLYFVVLEKQLNLNH